MTRDRLLNSDLSARRPFAVANRKQNVRWAERAPVHVHRHLHTQPSSAKPLSLLKPCSHHYETGLTLLWMLNLSHSLFWYWPQKELLSEDNLLNLCWPSLVNIWKSTYISDQSDFPQTLLLLVKILYTNSIICLYHVYSVFNMEMSLMWKNLMLKCLQNVLATEQDPNVTQ